jgi:hypothetical protein
MWLSPHRENADALRIGRKAPTVTGSHVDATSGASTDRRRPLAAARRRAALATHVIEELC